MMLTKREIAMNIHKENFNRVYSAEYDKNLMRLLSEKYPTKEAVYEKLIYLEARLAMPKEAEHFMSDLHGEYDLFYHIINNCSGVIREKVNYVFGVRMTKEEKAEFCTLIYYPREKLRSLREEGRITPDWYRKTLFCLLELAKAMSYKFPSFKIRGFIPENYATIILELMNTRPEGSDAQFIYHQKLKENHDIESVSDTVELTNRRMTVGDTDHGRGIKDEIANLKKLLAIYTGECKGNTA